MNEVYNRKAARRPVMALKRLFLLIMVCDECVGQYALYNISVSIENLSRFDCSIRTGFCTI